MESAVYGCLRIECPLLDPIFEFHPDTECFCGILSESSSASSISATQKGKRLLRSSQLSFETRRCREPT